MELKKIPVDEDTKVKVSHLVDFNGNDACFQQWTFDGIAGKSLILDSKEYHKVDEEDLKREVRQFYQLDQEDLMTLKRTDDYIFINFGFETS